MKPPTAGLARHWPWLVLAAITLAQARLLARIGTAAYSPDSWGYLELAQSIFSGDFYHFVTQRSYFTQGHSAAFPAGYPTLLALAQTICGTQPLVSATLNVLLGALTGTTALVLASRLGWNRTATVALVATLLLWPPYVDEVLAGRAIPLALLVWSAALLAASHGRWLAAGWLLGTSAVVRFDFLIYGGLTLGLLGLFGARAWPDRGRLVAGFAAGLTPWIAYSRSHFGVFWVSDNSWVAAAAHKAHVLDYPAQARLTAREAPRDWLLRLAGNARPMLAASVYASLHFPVVLALALAAAWQARTLQRGRRWLLAAGLGALALGLVPMLLTGYRDERYFAAPCWMGSLLLLGLLPARTWQPAAVRWTSRLLLLGALAWGTLGLVRVATNADLHASERAAADATLARWEACHRAQPQLTYLYDADSTLLGTEHGARTGLPGALLPGNWQDLDERQRAQFLSSHQPLARIGRTTPGCPRVTTESSHSDP